MLKKTNRTLTQKFYSGFKWSISGSLSYESIKILHQALLLHVMENSVYGLMGSIFSIIYLVAYFADFGLSYTLPTFLNIFTKNKTNFKKLFIQRYLLPQLFIITVVSIISTYVYTKSFFNSPASPFLWIIPLIILFESIRIFFRRFLHNVFMSKQAVIADTILLFVYFFAIWIPYVCFNIRITTNMVFVPYLLNSVFCTLAFIFFTYQYYKTLPDTKMSYPKHLWKRIFKTRIFNYSIHMSKNFFTGNFLTPFFAATFGLRIAGVFNLSNHIAESIKAIIKSTIIFSGNALFAKLKSTSIKIKRNAFTLLFQKLNLVIYPIIIFILINYKHIITLKGYAPIPQTTLSLSMLFLIISMSEYFFIIYEQFYIIEERNSILFVFKLFEFLLFYVFISSNHFASPATAMLGLITIKSLSLAVISTTAYGLWKIKPSFYIKPKYLMYCGIISILCWYFLSTL